MDATNIIYLIILGAIAGWLVGQIFKGRGFGLLANIIIGIIGGIIGGLLFSALGINLGSEILSALVSAVIGGGILVWILSFFGKKV